MRIEQIKESVQTLYNELEQLQDDTEVMEKLLEYQLKKEWREKNGS